MNKTILFSAVALSLLGTGAVRAQEPAENISRSRHGNLAAAQDLVRQAFDRLTVAQQDNEFDLGGHAGRAKELLRQASDEMRQAASAANRHER
ncbi:hypothetical protein [Sphingomonas bacterium]|uniref:hypothetical protein n=1 Tax=Sphingomonas bacterium TaxID=1895847 RepID=UPI001576F50E|nr:hypothetical protein [Sphingomonas bacterium]